MSDRRGGGEDFDDGHEPDWDRIWQELRAIGDEEVELSGAARERIRGTWMRELSLQGVEAERRPRVRRRRLVELTAIAAALLAVVVTLALTGPTHGDQEEPRVAADRTSASTAAPRAVPTLEELAEAALDQPALILGEDGTYAHRVTVTNAAPAVAGAPANPVRLETWIALDGSGRTLIEAGETIPPEDVRAGPGELRLGGKIAPVDVLSLPTDDVEGLLVRLRELLRLPADLDGLGAEVGSLLAEAGVPPAVRSALLRALAAEGFRPAEEQLDRASYTYEGPTMSGHLVLVIGEDTVPRSLQVDGTGGASNIATSYEAIDLRDDLS